ncbi:MAG: ArsR family transcriptional regulator, partial [Aggregatilineales bacterium]
MSIQEVLGTNTDSTRWSVIKALRACGGATVTELAEMVGVKPVTIRHHLISLQAEGLVDVTMKRHGVGRPSHFYRLTRKADRLFPHSYHVLVDRLLGEIKENFPPETVNMLIDSLADSMASDVRRQFADLPPEERRARLVEWMEEHGLTVR